MTPPRNPAPEWWKPGMPDEEIADWLAAERAVDTASEVRPGDPVALRVQTLFADFPAWLRRYRAAQQSTAA